MEAARRVGDDRRVAARGRGVHRIEDHSGRVALGLARDDRHLHPLGPSLELLDGRGAEGVRAGEQRALAGVLEALRELRRGCRLATAVYADDQDDPRPLPLAREAEIARERGDERLADRRERLGNRLQLAGDKEIAQLGHQRVDK